MYLSSGSQKFPDFGVPIWWVKIWLWQEKTCGMCFSRFIINLKKYARSKYHILKIRFWDFYFWDFDKTHVSISILDSNFRNIISKNLTKSERSTPSIRKVTSILVFVFFFLQKKHTSGTVMLHPFKASPPIHDYKESSRNRKSRPWVPIW